MDPLHLAEKYGPTVRQYVQPIVLGGLGIVLLLYGLIASVLPQKEKEGIKFESAHSTSSGSSTSTSEVKQLTVDIEGAVMKPGVYKLNPNSRVHDALIAAGGFSEKADREKIAKGLNLAAKVTDGGKIYIPFIGDSLAVSQTGSPLRQGFEGQAGQNTLGDSISGLININSASPTELDTLSGVGPATAEKIIASRPYEKIEDLLTKKAVGQAVFEKIKDKISVY